MSTPHQPSLGRQHSGPPARSATDMLAAHDTCTVVRWSDAGLVAFCSPDLDQRLLGSALDAGLLSPAAALALRAAVAALPPLAVVRTCLRTRMPTGELDLDWHSVRLPARADGPAENLSLLIDVGSRAGAVAAQAATMAANEAASEAAIEAASEARAAAQLQALRDQQEAFVAALSHELRDPLAPLRNAAYLLRNVAPDSSQRGEIVQLIERQIDQMARRLDRLLDPARGSTPAAVHAPVHLQLALREAVEQVSGQVDAAGQTLLRKVPAGPIRVQGDAARLAEMVATLLHHAIRCTSAGGLVELALHTEGGKAVISVRDNGAGLDAEQIAQLFDGQQRLLDAQPPDGNAPGAQLQSDETGRGLALATVKALAAAHGGTVQAQSAGSGRGSTLLLTLPLLQEAPATQAPVREGDAARPGLRVIVVDDNRDNANTLNTLLTMMGHQVRVGYDGTAALQAAAAAPFDAMLLDVGLPDIDGYEVARRLRAQGMTAPLIAVSGYGQPRDKERALTAGFDKHLTKPVSIRDVATVLGEVVLGLRRP